MKRIISLIGLLGFWMNLLYAQTYCSLDQTDMIDFKGSYIGYRGKKIKLDERNLFVDGQLSDAEVAKYPYVFNSFRQAAEYLKAGTEKERMTVYLAPYVYWVDDPDDPTIRVSKEKREPFGLKVNCPWLKIVGLTQKPENVVLASNRGQMQGAVGNFTMFYFIGDGISLNNITLGNYCNVDLEYPLLPSLNRRKRMPAITQAQLAYATGDRLEAHHVRFISRLNLCPLNGGKRTLFEDCYFESTDDALCGTGVYLNCKLTFYGSKPFYATSETGAVFLNCDFYVKSGNRQYLTKAESPVVLVDCRFHADLPVFLGWTQDPTDKLRCYQSNVTCNGKPIVMNDNHPGITVDMEGKALLNAYKVEYKGKMVYNTYNLLAGDDDWDPMGVKPDICQAEKTWNKKLTHLPVHLSMIPSEVKIEADKADATLKVVVKRFGGYDDEVPPLIWCVSKQNLVQLSPMVDAQQSIRGVNQKDVTDTLLVEAFTVDGLACASIVESAPAFVNAPAFIRSPRISLDKKGFLKVDYELALEGRKDESLITWYRCKDAQGTDAVAVAVSRLNKPEYTYKLQPGDAGHYIKVSVAPKHLRCHAGIPQSHIFQTRVTMDGITDIQCYDTDFQHFPTDWQPRILPGYWTVDGYKPLDTKAFDWTPNSQRNWYYGTGFDAAVGTGLMQENKGARLLYTPLEGIYGDMTVELEVDPCKQAGQGFGSATGQYMDVYIKFDTRTLSGYALRIIRTTKYHNAVDFLLVRYENGIVTPLTQPVSATCYLSGCTLKIWTAGGKLMAHVETKTPQPGTTDPNLKQKVYLEATLMPNSWGGTGIQHTGSTGPSATMLHRLKINWE